jgi:IS5 family transposase
VSVATTIKQFAGGQFVAHVASLPGNPYDCHTPATVIKSAATPIRCRASLLRLALSL